MRIFVMADAASVHTERWCRFFEQRGHMVALFSLEAAHRRTPEIYYQGKRPTGIGLLDYHLAKQEAKRCLDEFKPDIVNPHFIVSYGWLAAETTSPPIISTAWGSDLLLAPKRSFVHRQRVQKALKKSVYCIVDGANLRREAATYLPADRILTMYWGVEREVVKRPARMDFNIKMPLRIIAPRGMAPVYDPDTIVKAAVKLTGQVEFVIDMIGSGTRAQRINDMITNFNLQDRIRLMAPVGHDEFVDALAQYDVYVSASHSDSTSVALLEAMVSGLCPVVTRIEGNHEWIDDHNGFLFTPGDSDSLAEAILAADRQRDRFSSIAEMNRQIVRERGVWEDHMERVEQLFKKVVTV